MTDERETKAKERAAFQAMKEPVAEATARPRRDAIQVIDEVLAKMDAKAKSQK